MKMNKIAKKLLQSLWILLMAGLCLSYGTVRAQAADFHHPVYDNYVKVGSSYFKAEFAGTKTNLYLKKNGKVYKKSVSKLYSSISDGTSVYYNQVGSKAVYKWIPAQNKTSKLCTLKHSGASLSCGTGNYIFYDYNYGDYASNCNVYRYDIKAKSTKLIRKNSFSCDAKGNYLLVRDSSGDPSPRPLYLYNIGTGKFKKLSSLQYSCGFVGNCVYYTRVDHTASVGNMSTTLCSYNIKTGKTTALKKGIILGAYGSYVGDKYLIYGTSKGFYKYTYSTKKTVYLGKTFKL